MSDNPAPPKSPANAMLANVLLVDDMREDIVLARITLTERAGLHCNLIFARSGEEALGILKSGLNGGKIDLMLLDINMPQMNGFEVLERMRTEELWGKTAVLMCTGSSYSKDIHIAEMMGAAGYLVKPVGFDALSERVGKIKALQLSPEGEGYVLLHRA